MSQQCFYYFSHLNDVMFVGYCSLIVPFASIQELLSHFGIRVNVPFTATQLDILRKSFESNPTPTLEEREAMAQQLDLPLKKISQWFCDRRRRKNQGVLVWGGSFNKSFVCMFLSCRNQFYNVRRWISCSHILAYDKDRSLAMSRKTSSLRLTKGIHTLIAVSVLCSQSSLMSLLRELTNGFIIRGGILLRVIAFN